MRKIKKCEFCGKKDFKFLFYGTDKLHGIPGKFRVVKCKNCGLVFINPQPSFKELEKYYPSEKYSPSKKYYSFNQIRYKEKDKNVRRKLFLYDLYFNPKNRQLFLKMLFSPLKQFVRGTKIIPKIKLLDIGCGSGQFLYEMKQSGIENVYGVEPGDFDERTAKKEGINILKSDLIKAKYPANFFDVITINQALEHVDNPSETIKEAYKILKKNGMFIVGVPNTRSLYYKIFGRNWYNLDVPRHLFDYSDKILINYLKKQGFKILKVKYKTDLNEFFCSFLYFLQDMQDIRSKKTKHCFINNKIIKLLFLPFTLIFGSILNILKLGGQIEIWCTKQATKQA